MGRGPSKVRRVIGGGVRAALVEGQDSHLIARPTGRGLWRHMALLTRQMSRDATYRRRLLEVSTTGQVTRIGMTELTLTNQGMGIGSVVHARHGRRMADSAEAATVIGRRATGWHGGDALLVRRGNQDALVICIKGMAGSAGIMNLTIGQTCRRPGSGPCCPGMARGAGRGPTNHGGMVYRRMAGRTVIGRSRGGVMMNAAGRISRNRVTGQAGRQTMQA